MVGTRRARILLVDCSIVHAVDPAFASRLHYSPCALSTGCCSVLHRIVCISISIFSDLSHLIRYPLPFASHLLVFRINVVLPVGRSPAFLHPHPWSSCLGSSRCSPHAPMHMSYRRTSTLARCISVYLHCITSTYYLDTQVPSSPRSLTYTLSPRLQLLNPCSSRVRGRPATSCIIS